MAHLLGRGTVSAVQLVSESGEVLSPVESTIADALIWCGGSGARYAYKRVPEIYTRRARVIAQALRDEGLLVEVVTPSRTDRQPPTSATKAKGGQGASDA